MFKFILKLQIAMLIILLVGCVGNIKYKQTLTFDANVPDVTVFIDNQSCLTPCSLDIIKSANDFNLLLKKDGYKTTEMLILSKATNNNYSFNLIMSPFTTSTIAHNQKTGYAYLYDPSSVFIYMEPNVSFVDDSDRSIMLFILNNYQSIKVEAYSNNIGEYIRALYDLSDVDPHHIMDLAKATNNAVNFAKLLMKENIYQKSTYLIDRYYDSSREYVVNIGELPDIIRELPRITKIHEESIKDMIVISDSKEQFKTALLLKVDELLK